MTPSLTPLTDEARAVIRERLARTGRAQIDGVLAVTDAQALYDAATAADYNVVTRRGTGHVDLPAAWLASLTPDQKQAVQASAQTDFQYLYDNHPIYDLV